MPDPKDYMDDKHQYVKGYVRRREAHPRRRSWFWNLAWYWRLLISIGLLVGFVVALLTNIYIVFGFILLVFLLLFLRQGSRQVGVHVLFCICKTRLIKPHLSAIPQGSYPCPLIKLALEYNEQPVQMRYVKKRGGRYYLTQQTRNTITQINQY